MKQYTIIEHDGQKWLSPVAPHGADPIAYHMNFSDLLYLGIRSVGETVDESEVREVHQWRNKNSSSSLQWRTVTYGNNAFREGINAAEYIEIRTAYVDVKVAIDESHKSDYWKDRKSVV